jgi:hypothetical protein
LIVRPVIVRPVIVRPLVMRSRTGGASHVWLHLTLTVSIVPQLAVSVRYGCVTVG